MSIEQLETDYLVIGAGAMGMAFVDELLTRTKQTRFIIVDRYLQPGGHWNTAYSFVHLHQPSAFYGVNSEKLEKHGGEFASKPELLSYYRLVLKKLLATGRVTFLSECEYYGDGCIRSLCEPNKEYRVQTRKKVVDATYMQVEVPSTRPPHYEVSADANLVPINALSSLERTYEGYVIIGAGKTGIDAVLYLLSEGVEPSKIRWVISRDVWYYDRENFSSNKMLDFQIDSFRCILDGTSVDGVFDAMGNQNLLLKLEPNIKPQVFRCATITKSERDQVLKIGEFIRLGRVQKVGSKFIELDDGSVPTSSEVLHVDCTANGLARRPSVPIFQDKKIVLQPILTCQQVFSAAVLALVESHFDDNSSKNLVVQPAHHPNTPAEWLASMHTSIANLEGLEPVLRFNLRMRLYPMSHTPFFRWFWKSLTVLLPMVPSLLDAIPKLTRKKGTFENTFKIIH